MKCKNPLLCLFLGIFINLLSCFIEEVKCQKTFNVRTFASLASVLAVKVDPTNDDVYALIHSASGPIYKIPSSGSPITQVSSITFVWAMDFALDYVNKNIYVGDSANQRIVKIVIATGVATNFAGTYGTAGYADGPISSALFESCRSMEFDEVSNSLYVGEVVGTGRMRKISLATNRVSSYSPVQKTNGFLEIYQPLSGTVNGFASYQGIMYFSDYHRIRKMLPDGSVTILAGSTGSGNGDGQGSNAQFNSPWGLAFDPEESLVFVNSAESHCVKVMDSSNTVTTVAGSCGSSGYSDLEGVNARFNRIFGMDIDSKGHLYVADHMNGIIRKIFQCRQGSTFDSVNKVCVYSTCRPGYKLVSSSCQICPLGSYKSVTGTGDCTTCPNGQESFSNRTNCLNCISGTTYRSSSSQSQCLPCPVNSQCTTTGFTCNAGFKLNSTSNSCDQCSANQVASGSTCNSCSSPNQYFVSSNKTCGNCPSNSSCDGITFVCYAGFTINFSATSCEPCSSGLFKSSSGNSTCYPCGLGTEPNTDKTSCISCSFGKYRPSLSYPNCIACPPYANCSAIALIKCNNGFKLNSMGDGCEDCAIGSQSSADSLSCVSCILGNTYRSSFTQTSCLPCPLNSVCLTSGFTCNAGYEPTGDGLGCSQCQDGFSKSAAGNTACTQCSIGTESAANKQSCVSCASGKYRPTTSVNKCITCPQNGNCSTSALSRCINGWKINSASDGCDQCPIGQESDGLTCSGCASGFMKPDQTYNVCIACPQGYSSCGGSSIVCQSGFYFDKNVQCKRNDTYFALMQTVTNTASTVTNYVTVTQTSVSTSTTTSISTTTTSVFATVTQSVSLTATVSNAQSTMTSLIVSTVSVVQYSPTNFNDQSIITSVVTIAQTQTVSLSNIQTVTAYPGSNSQSQSAQSITVDFIGTLPISPLMFGLVCLGMGLFIMLILSLVCCRKSPSRRKDEEFDAPGMTSTLNTTSQRTFTNTR